MKFIPVTKSILINYMIDLRHISYQLLKVILIPSLD